MIVTRFAPSPNGSLHLGHAYSAIAGHDKAAADGGEFLLRIEDIDGERSRPELAEQFRADLAWLGLRWTQVPPQSTRLSSYDAAARKLEHMGVLYPCTCTRADLALLAKRKGPGGLIYPGTCKGRPLVAGRKPALRLDVDEALRITGPLIWEDAYAGSIAAEPQVLGDVVLVRTGAPASYHLAATLDDAADGVSLVTRGRDLFVATHVHRLLQALLDLPVPLWHHHGLLVDDRGRKLAKRRHSPSLADRRFAREDGLALANELRMGRFPAGISLDTP